MFGELHEECGVFGICAPSMNDVASSAYYGLYALQHRGQESCGIAVYDNGELRCKKAIGLVREVFSPEVLSELGRGSMAIGHVRYATTGGNSVVNAQPITTRHLGEQLATVHNGNLTNAALHRNELEAAGMIFQTTCDTEIISYLLTRERASGKTMEDAASATAAKLEGAFSLIIMHEDGLIAIRDKHGFRPLCYGKTRNGSYVIASESCALNAVGAYFIRDIAPGELVSFSKSGEVKSITGSFGKAERSMCIFEYIYFARPDSIIDGCSVHHARMRAGELLAAQHPVDADIVVGVPDSGIDAAVGYANTSGIPYGLGFIKNKYIGRTFIAPDQQMREDGVKIKLSPIAETISGKRVVLIDDSIVRGTTSAWIVRMLREAGAKEIHMRITSPPFRYPCWYGTDIDSGKGLIAWKHSIEEIKEIIGCDSLGYLSTESLPMLAGQGRGYCTACFTGKYETSIPQSDNKSVFEAITKGDGHCPKYR